MTTRWFKHPFSLLLFILFFRFLFLLFYIAKGVIPLAPDEAQYWTWSQALDFGYYSKPPGIAWLIHFTTSIIGNSELGVRLGALLFGSLFSIALYFVSRKAKLSHEASFFCAVVGALSPAGSYLSFAATTDTGALLFVTLAIGVMVEGIAQKKEINFLRLGLWMLLGLLFKWTLLWIWLIVFLLLPFYPSLRKKGLILSFLLSLLAFLPSLYWNYSHDYATFHHVAKTVVETTSSANPLDFLLSQVALFSPLFFFLYLASLRSLFRLKKEKALCFLALLSFGLFFFLIASFFKKIQANWALLFFPPAMVLAAWQGWDRSKHPKVWLASSSLLALAALFFTLAIPLIQSEGYPPHLSYQFNPFRQCMGNSNVTKVLIDIGYNPKEQFLFSDKYQATSLLSFYGPGQKRAYFFNISENRKNQFSYWEGMNPKEISKSGFFCLIENEKKEALSWYKSHYAEALFPYFEKVTFLGSFPLFKVEGVEVKTLFIFGCKNYNGKRVDVGTEY